MIDFHTHIFPEKIAEKTLSFLASRCGVQPSTDGTAAGLSASVRESGLDLAVVLPVVTKPSQFVSVNRFASQFQEGDLLSFGGIHPDTENYKERLRELKGMGFRGVKLHPDYQETFIDDIRYKRIISYASDLDLIVSVHAGFDPGYPDCVHCPPRRAQAVIRDVQPRKLILAHLGGFMMWDEVEEYLVGEDVWMDTAAVWGHIEEEQFVRIVRGHGADRVLFATDCPWGGQREAVEYFDSLPLTAKEKAAISDGNARELLNRSIFKDSPQNEASESAMA